jgi:Ca2+-binding RTX toxin-like protein
MVALVASKPVNTNALELFDVMSDIDAALFSNLTVTGVTITLDDVVLVVEGTGFADTAGSDGIPDVGEIDKITVSVAGVTACTISSIDLDVPHFLNGEGVPPTDLAQSFFSKFDQFQGSSGKDTLHGFGENDSLVGNKGADSLFGGDLNDYLNGGPGKDKLDGGPGTNAAGYEEKNAPVVVTLKSGETVKSKVGGKVEDTLTNMTSVFGGSASDQLTGDAGANTLQGHGGKDRLRGNDGTDSLWGDEGADELRGGPGDDTLYGLQGKDRLTGGADSDDFVFLTLGKNDVDRITDLAPGDQIRLVLTTFTALTEGPLDAKHFQIGKADDDDDFVLYFKGKGELHYDPDGDDPLAAILFARITPGYTLDASYFFVPLDL